MTTAVVFADRRSTAERIDGETRRLIEEARSRVRRILDDHREALGRLAGELVRRETLERDELLALVRAPALEVVSR
jgi:ATP-dependent Zn protease